MDFSAQTFKKLAKERQTISSCWQRIETGTASAIPAAIPPLEAIPKATPMIDPAMISGAE
ncbi:hypothetical protein D3C81_2314770 [compost metagenome]